MKKEYMQNKNANICAFDIGVASLGLCVRRGQEVSLLESLLIPAEYASTKEAAKRRRLIRTRIAHHKREAWWRQCCEKYGIETLESRQPIYDAAGKLVSHKPDPRMLREFSAAGDNTIYNSALLRIALLQGQKLEGWQVFKAVWSAFQHRGYLPAAELPWAKRSKRNIDEEDAGKTGKGDKDGEAEDEKKNAEAASAYTAILKTYPEDCQLPCYFEAERMGLWSPAKPKEFKLRHETPAPGAARNKDGVGHVAPRALVEKEIRLLLQQAGKLFPKLKGREAYVMYGEPGIAFPSVTDPKKWGSIRGGEGEAKGVLSQKTPRFDNRAVNKCRLIPRLNVCKANDELNREVSFLLALKNMRYSFGDKPDCALDPEQLKELFGVFTADKSKSFHITPTKWRKWVQERLKSEVNPAHPAVTAAKLGGRSSFCRPALRLLKELILSGQSPVEFHAAKAKEARNEDPRKGLVKAEYDFLRDLGDSWYSIHIPDNRLADARAVTAETERRARIDEIINDVRNPVVRHRLRVLIDQFKRLKDRHGAPDRIYFEFIREDFMGEKARREYEARIRTNKKERDEAHKAAEELKLKGDGLLKMRLYREQGGVDYYASGESEKIAQTDIDNCQIDHIVPRAQGGPDAFYNLILTSRANNSAKGDRTPWEWLKGDKDAWARLSEKVGRNNRSLSPKKKRLLLSAEPQKLVEKYTALAETAYIAKLAAKLASLYFGWPESVKGSEKRIFISNGAQTARIRRRYKLDRLLHPDIEKEEDFVKLVRDGKLDKKNRDNPRHHALDALVISMGEDLKYDANGDMTLPAWFHSGYVKSELEKVAPANIRFEKPTIAQTIYGMRKTKDGYVMVATAKTSQAKPTRLEDWGKLSLEQARKRVKDIYSEQIRSDFEAKLGEEALTSEQWAAFVTGYRCKNGTRPRKISYVEARDINAGEDGKAPAQSGEILEARKRSMPGQYIKDLKAHQGQLVYKDGGKWKVEPVYVWESLHSKTVAIHAKYGKGNVRFFRSGQSVEVSMPCRVPAGRYVWKSIEAERGRVELKGGDGKEYKRIPVSDLIDNGRLEVIGQ
ncbi:MAG TPA: HNH endonuclease domain-containing protein [Elusimicrobiales bacterium]|nr:HNH endonuclease domain-containing protein [Elusimicrobiales bacterium]